MLNLIDLEARWLRYKLRLALPYLVLFVLFLVLLFALFYYLGKKSQTQQDAAIDTNITKIAPAPMQTQSVLQTQPVAQTQPQTPQAAQVQQPPLQTQPVAQAQAVIQTQPVTQMQPLVQTQQIQESTTVLKPSMEFMNHISSTTSAPRASQPDYYTQGSFTAQDEETTFEPAQNYEEEIVEVEDPQTPEYVHEASKKIDIERKNDSDDIQGVIKRFNKNNNPALSLFVAKKYYEMGDYSNAYNYALITNNINAEIESSWLIFAKSLVKLGKKEMAARTLQEYIESSNSKRARRLLDDILNGKFK